MYVIPSDNEKITPVVMMLFIHGDLAVGSLRKDILPDWCKKQAVSLFFLLPAVCFSEKMLSFAPLITGVAQSVEYWSPKPGVGGSSPSSRA